MAKTRLFADDCVIYRPIKTTKDCLQLQDDLHRLAQLEDKWGMCFHPEKKCSILRVTRARSPVLHPYTLKGQFLHTDEQSKYLGVDITSNLSWNPHIDRIVKKGNSMLGRIEAITGHQFSFSALDFCSVWVKGTAKSSPPMLHQVRPSCQNTFHRGAEHFLKMPFIHVSPESHFPIQNLPYGVFSTSDNVSGTASHEYTYKIMVKIQLLHRSRKLITLAKLLISKGFARFQPICYNFKTDKPKRWRNNLALLIV